jgi:hypothetical protein
MNTNESQTNNADTNLNDLAVAEAEQSEVKGGPKRIFIGGLSVKDSQAGLLDLEPQGEIVGGGLTGNRIAPPFNS